MSQLHVSQYQTSPHNSFNGVNVPHHQGLQALQPASAVTSPPPGLHLSPTGSGLGSHYAQAKDMQPTQHLDDRVYDSIEHGLPDMPTTPMQAFSTSPSHSSSAHHKVTRLRRACDMCSQRKVKVSTLVRN